MTLKYPFGWYLYAGVVAVSSLLILFGLHREFYALLQTLSAPDLVVSCLTGLTNLGWYEIAYLVGGGLKKVILFTLIPFAGSITGLISASLLLTSVRIRRLSLLFHIVFSLFLGGLSLLVLLWRMVRDMDDPWRFAVSMTFFLFYSYWFLYFYRTRRFFSDIDGR